MLVCVSGKKLLTVTKINGKLRKITQSIARNCYVEIETKKSSLSIGRVIQAEPFDT